MEMQLNTELNLVAIIFFAGAYISTLRNHTAQIAELKEDFKETIKQIREDFDVKFEDFKSSVTEHFERVEKKQDKHNHLIERTYELEKRADVQEEQIKVANHRLEDLERK